MKVTSQNLSIMLTDIQGYSDASASSSRGQLMQILRNHNRLMIPVIRFHGGTIIKQIGDAFLVTFGSATDATVCAIMIQLMLREFNRRQRDETRKLQLRVVINTGDVTLQDGDIFGDAVNITARIEGLSCFPGGSIGISESTFLLMNRNEIVAELVGPQQLKGIPNPVNVYSVPIDKQRLNELPTRLLELVEYIIENQHTSEVDFEHGMRQIINVDPGFRSSDAAPSAATVEGPTTPPPPPPPAPDLATKPPPTTPIVSPALDAPHTEASYGLRFKSLLIDVLVLALFLFSFAAHAKVTILLLPPLYLILMWTIRGATVGQLVCRLGVVCAGGQPPEFFTALLRMLFFPLSFVPLLFGKEKLLHDILGNTQVLVLGVPLADLCGPVDASLFRRGGAFLLDLICIAMVFKGNILAAIIYCTISWRWLGASPGQWLTGLTVIGPEGQRLSFVLSLWRSLLFVLFFPGWVVPLPPAGWRPTYDLITNTRVVYRLAGQPIPSTKTPATPTLPAPKGKPRNNLHGPSRPSDPT